MFCSSGLLLATSVRFQQHSAVLFQVALSIFTWPSGISTRYAYLWIFFSLKIWGERGRVRCYSLLVKCAILVRYSQITCTQLVPQNQFQSNVISVSFAEPEFVNKEYSNSTLVHSYYFLLLVNKLIH